MVFPWNWATLTPLPQVVFMTAGWCEHNKVIFSPWNANFTRATLPKNIYSHSDPIWLAQHHLLVSIFLKILRELCLVCKRICSKMKWTKNRVLTDGYGTSFKIKFIKWSLLFGFCVDLHLPLLSFTFLEIRWVGLNRRWCRSRRWFSSVEVGFSHTITSKSFEFWNLQDFFVAQLSLIYKKIKGI